MVGPLKVLMLTTELADLQTMAEIPTDIYDPGQHPRKPSFRNSLSTHQSQTTCKLTRDLPL
jgi:hypothetical protein